MISYSYVVVMLYLKYLKCQILPNKVLGWQPLFIFYFLFLVSHNSYISIYITNVLLEITYFYK